MSQSSDPVAYPVFSHQLRAMLAKMAREDQEAIGPALRKGKFGDIVDHVEMANIAASPVSKPRSNSNSRGRATFIDFSYASPLGYDRRQPLTIRIPHFSMKPITAVVVPVASDGRTHPRYLAKSGIAAKHHDYVSKGAHADFATHLDYIRRQADRRSPASDDPLLIDMLDVESDRNLRNNLGVHSNIPGGATCQRSLFEAAERCERRAKGGRLVVSTQFTDAWVELAQRRDAPVWVKHTANVLLGGEKDVLREAERVGGKPRHRAIAICKVSLREAYDRLSWADNTLGNTAPALPNFEAGPSGRVQTRFVMELPRGLEAWQHRKILENIGDHFHREGWMYVAAIHRPDPHNDPDNFHIHLDAYDRPSTWLPDHECWDFEYREKKRNGKWTYPFRQNKISVMRPSKEGQSSRKAAEEYLKAKRAAYIDIVNDVVAGQSGVPRFVAGTYAQNGINLTPLKHLGNRTISNEKRGVVTPAGSENARQIIVDHLTKIRRIAVTGKANIRREVARAVESGSTLASIESARSYRRKAYILLSRAAQAAMVEIVADMLRSRAETVIQYSKRDDIQAVAEAENWLNSVNELAPNDEDRASEKRRIDEMVNDLNAVHAKMATLGQEKRTEDRRPMKLDYLPRSVEPISPLLPPYAGMVRGRLMAWLDTYGHDEERLTFQADCCRLGDAESRPSIDRLFRLFITEATVQDRLQLILERREQAATPIGKEETSAVPGRGAKTSSPLIEQARTLAGWRGAPVRSKGPIQRGEDLNRERERPFVERTALGVRSKGPLDEPHPPVLPKQSAKNRGR